MTLLLGIDTGGTYTDAVLYDEASGQIVTAAKSLTTKHDLALCVGDAIDRALAAAPDDAKARIGLVSLSTTLATNAIVEQHGFPVALVMIGQSPQAMDRAGLSQALGTDPVFFIDGGHEAGGQERASLDEAAVLDACATLRDKAAAVAVSGYFAVRNPTHESRVRDLIRAETGLPVSCGHDLASALDAPRRALTALLNARLIPLLQHLILAVRGHLEQLGIQAPLMVVKGDGSLIAAESALTRPVETILSGPAASVVGARALAGEADCVVSDIGGTTTDIAVLVDGKPVMDPDGASVGGYRTMVEAVAVRTIGLGGDSEVRLDEEKNLIIGPRRIVPISLLARDWPAVTAVLHDQAARAWPKDQDGRFALRLRTLGPGTKLSRNEAAVWDQLDVGPVSLEKLFAGRASEQPLQRLVDRGLVILSGFTPSDAAHVLGRQDDWDSAAARLAATLMARSERRAGHPLAPSASMLAEWVIDQLTRQSGEAIIATALAEEDRTRRHAAQGQAAPALAAPAWAAPAWAARMGDGVPFGPSAKRFLDNALGPDTGGGMLSFTVTLNRPLIAIGAPAATYYPGIAARLGARLVVPDGAGVCNALGAVAGGVSQRQTILITAPEEGRYRLHTEQGLEDFQDLEKAAARAEVLVREGAQRKAREAGAGEIHTHQSRTDRTAQVGPGHEVFVESEICATAYGRPRLSAAAREKA